MPVIKRYPNRKLYDTEAKQYITLEEIAGLIRRGSEVRVVDNATGEDLTALTLTQVILELEKKQSGFFPRSILTGLIQSGGDRLNALQRSLSSSLSFWHQIDEEIKRRIQVLISQGELTEGEGRNLVEKLIAQETQSISETRLQEDLERIMAQRQIPSHQDLQNLLDQLDSLGTKLEELRKENK
jgi:polyhydroxyalkanoate synthesis repressor PhaR